MASEPIWKREGFTSRNQYRSAQARKKINPETGKPYTSYRQQRDVEARRRGKPRDTKREKETADRRARMRGYSSANRMRAVSAAALSKWDISLGQLESFDKANIEHYMDLLDTSILARDFPMYLHEYQPPTEGNAPEYVGYIVTYYHAIVDRSHNWDSVRDSSGQWMMTERMVPHKGMSIVPESDIWWYRHFVQYSNKQNHTYYESRYGIVDA